MAGARQDGVEWVTVSDVVETPRFPPFPPLDLGPGQRSSCLLPSLSPTSLMDRARAWGSSEPGGVL